MIPDQMAPLLIFISASSCFHFVFVWIRPGLALTFVLENSFKPESGSRPGVPKIGILITDGKSQDDVIPPAQSLKDAGIELFAIGMTALNAPHTMGLAVALLHVQLVDGKHRAQWYICLYVLKWCSSFGSLSSPSYKPADVFKDSQFFLWSFLGWTLFSSSAQSQLNFNISAVLCLCWNSRLLINWQKLNKRPLMIFADIHEARTAGSILDSCWCFLSYKYF